ncbi:Oligopeptide transport ATP-binding protein OppD [Chlamydia pneumoniae]|uniref:Oligopeptide transport ATP-binding protein OppD n=3 Tax=Chlamydia pneumoniae TaxID=83558 RepID=A0A0F7WJS2_CHLPN|nr:Oligopeptide transport ATP-binding protein OppD [Chlamydia pneumoniae]CRI36062.1 Oligopeptide transport ATP-binding protein OppD [Chlamydia pneumoniae]CRI37189.1 Oligopeptide transport ATP-binding protein OppD [Chlamydia pneumoniae]CRI38317.1 Oligopeptide transport ATP-binding protein OppD [Chlamydia pneumoniae]CRI39449.1 Oligopeptide transport ATP-binding protein OppD [Chlamydia pneumoniae]
MHKNSLFRNNNLPKRSCKRLMASNPILQIEDLSITLAKQRQQYPIVQSLSFTINEGQTLAIIGESGSGKSVSAHAILRLLPCPPFSVSGQVNFQGHNLLTASRSIQKKIIGTEISMIFQNPQASLNPVFTIEQQFREIIHTHLALTAEVAKEKMLYALEETGFHDPRLCLNLYPHQLSGGMLQRICIAMALLCSPKLLIADEPTTALDVSVQYQILQLLKTLQKKTGMSLLIITHNMGVVAETADDVLVLYAGRMVECAPAVQMFHNPSHPYTRDLLASRPSLQPQQLGSFNPIPGQPPHYTAFPSGCRYHPRCSKILNRCSAEAPEIYPVREGHKVRCWLYDD